jgi:RHS repeat-associated protein
VSLPGRQRYRAPGRGRFDPATSQRVGARSSESTDLFENADGSVTTVVSAGRTNFRATDGSYQPIDTTLVAREDGDALARPGGRSGDVRLESAANDVLVSLAGPAYTDPARAPGGSDADEVAGSWQELASVTLPSGEVVGYGLRGARPVLPTVDGSTATYHDVLPSTDIELVASSVGLKETIVLRSAQAQTSWVFPLRLTGLSPSLAGDGSVQLRNGAGAVAAWIPPGWMSDSRFNPASGEMTTSTAVTYELVEVDGGPALRVTVDKEWVTHPDRVFPIRVDPTTVETSGDVFVDNLDGGPPHNGNNLPVGTFDGGATRARSFLRFSGFAPVAGHRVTAASLDLFHSWSYDCNTHLPVAVSAVASSWSVSSLSSLPASGYPGPALGQTAGMLNITNNYPACQNTAGDRSVGAWRSASLGTDVFNAWAVGTLPNHGLALTTLETDSYGWKRFTSQNHDNGSKQAKLQLTWTPYTAPHVENAYPGSGFAVGTLTPELVAVGKDGSGPLQYRFYVYDTAMAPVADSLAWSASPRWAVPSGKLTWGGTYLWYAVVTDGVTSAASGWQSLSVRVPQPLITGGLSQNPDGPGFSPVTGNYTTTAVDASVATVGPQLAISRSYNSRDPRTSGAFGAGWSSIVDAHVRPATSGTPPALMTVRYPTGQEVTFGRNADGTWDAGSGRYSVLEDDGGWALTDKNATTFTFGESLGGGRYGLSSVTDAAGRTLTLTYASGRVSTITSASSERALHLTWTGSRVSSVSTDPADPGDPTGSVSTWTYGYDGGRLVSVCPPATPTQCHAYTYAQAEEMSLHPTAVQDAGPRSYFRLGVQDETTADNLVTDSLHLSSAVLHNTGSGAGPFPGSPAATFNGSSAYVQLTNEDAALDSYYQSVSLWFKTPASSTTGGVLLATQDAAVGSTQTRWSPILYVGTDGKLRYRFWDGTSTATTRNAPLVNDGSWHHVVVTSTPSQQELVLDGVADAVTTNRATSSTHMGHVLVGAGYWNGYPGTSGTAGHSYFSGSIAEVALFDRALTEAEADVLHDTGATVTRPLTEVARPSAAVGTIVDYDAGTGRVDTLTDANGGTWTVGSPDRSGSDLTYAAAVIGAGPSNYWRFAQPNGQSAVNEVNGQEADLYDVTLGESGPFADIALNPPTAAWFDGAQSEVYVEDAPVDTTQAFTVSTWVRLETEWADQYMAVMDGQIGNSAFKLLYEEYYDRWVATMSMRHSDGSNVWNYVAGPTGGVAVNEWTHLTATADPVANKLILYVNGEKVGEHTPTLPFNNPTLGMAIGHQYGSAHMEGGLAEFATFRRALSADEVSALYKAFERSTSRPVKTIEVTDPMGATSSTVYDLLSGGRLIRSTDTRGESTMFGYDTGGFLYSVTDPNGNTVITGHDPRGNLVSRSACQDQSANLCSTAYFTHWPEGNSSRTIPPDARNDSVLTARDGRSSGPADNTYRTTYAYDTAGNRTGVTDALQQATTTVYSMGAEAAVGGGTVPPGLPLTITGPGGGMSTVEYYDTGDVAATTDVSGLRTVYSYDALGRLVELEEISDSYPAGLVSSYTYDKNGNPTTSTAPPVVNRVTGATHTAKTTVWYNADGQPVRTRVEDLTGGDALRETEQGHNPLGQVQWVSDAQGRRTYYTYDPRGNRITATPADAQGDPLAQTIAYGYDGEGHLLTTSVVDYHGPDDHLLLESRDYDPAGRLARVVDAMGWELHYTYTDDNRLRTTTREDAATEQSYVIETKTYGGAGHVTSITSANGTVVANYSVDAAGRTTSATVDPTGVNRTTSYTFDRNDQVVSTVVNDATGASQRTDALYDAAGNLLTQTAYPTGVTAPVGRWRLDETTGLTAADTSGNSPATATTSGVTWSSDHGGSVLLDGDDGWLGTAGPVLDTTRAYTVAAWVKLDASVSGEAYAVSQDGGVRSGFYLGYYDSLNRWAFYLCQPNTQSSGCSAIARSNAAPAFGTWTHIAGVYDPAAAEIRLYVNGTLRQTKTVTTDRPPATGPLRIGSGLWDGDTHDRFPGSIDDVQTYQTALTTTQIAQIYSGAAPAAGAGVIRTSATVDQRGLPVTSTDPNGATTYLDYDEAGRAVVTTAPSALAEEHGSTPVTAPAVSMVGFDTFGAVTQSRDPKGRVITTAYNANGQPVSTTLPSYTPPDGGPTITGASSTVEYDTLGRLWKTTDPLDNVTEHHYDALSRVDWVKTPDDGVTAYEYSLAGQTLAVVDPTGARTEATWDYLGRQLTGTQIVRQPSTVAHTTSYEYWPSGQLKTITPAGRNATVYQYNGVGETTSVIDAAGNTHQYTYDFAGRSARTILPDGSGQRVSYDGAGRPVLSETLATNGTTVLANSSVVYDRAGNTVTATDPRGHTTQFAYNPLGALTQVTEPVTATESITTSYGYDLAGAPTRFTNGRGHQFWTTYNTWGLAESTIEPSTSAHPALADRTFTTVYDRAGRTVRQLQPGGVSTTNTYDDMGQLVTAAGAGAEVVTTTRAFEYDLTGRPTEITGSGGTNTLTWDDRGALLSVAGPSGNSSYTYTTDGLLASRVDAAGTTSYAYDPASRLSTITNTGTGVDVSVDYNPLSQIETLTYTAGANSRHRNFGYDPRHRLISDVVVEPAPSTVELGRIEYGYDANSNITSKNTQGFAGAAENTYTYDRANRLTSWIEDDGSSTTLTSYTYDPAGNRTGNGTRTFTYDQRNRLTADSDANTYTYTPRGTRSTQVVSGQTLHTHSDAFGQVLRQDSAGQQTTYTYDGLGRLLQTGHQYTGLGNDLAADATTSYTRDPAGGLVGAATTSAQRVVWTDQHTDVVGQFTPAGATLAGSATYDPLGNDLAASGLIGSLGYQSEYTDTVTGRVNMHARWYNPDTGQFDNRDTIPQSPVPASVNANSYAYANANPLRYSDPTGHWNLEGNEETLWVPTVGGGYEQPAFQWTRQDDQAYTAQRQARKAYEKKLEEAMAARGPCTSDAVYGQGVCAGATAVEPVCPAALPDRQTVKLIMGEVQQAKVLANCTTVIVGINGDAYINGLGINNYLSTQVWDPLNGNVTHTTTVNDLALVIDNVASQHGGYAADGSDRLLVTMYALHYDLGNAYGLTDDRRQQQQEAECQKSFMCRNQEAMSWIGTGLSIVAAVGCGIATAGAMAVACFAATGAAINVAMDAASGNVDSFGDVINSAATGAALSLLGSATGGIGGLVAKSLLRPLTGLGGRLSAAIGGAVTGGVGAALYDLATTGSINPFNLALGVALGGAGGYAFGKGCPRHSFAAGTPVLMADGTSKAIEDVGIGEEVLATDPDTGETDGKPVIALHLNLDTELTDVTVTVPTDQASDDGAAVVGEGDGGRSTRGPTTSVTLHTTVHHPFWDDATQEWVNAGDLTPGESHLRTPADATVTVTQTTNYTGTQRMHDLTVADIHTYYVVAGSTPVLVHNCGGGVSGHPGTCTCGSMPGYRSFRAAKRALGSPGSGNVFDHVVERSQIGRSSFAAQDVHNPFNLNPVPARINQLKADYYSSKRSFTGGGTVRDWLTGQSYRDQYEFGMDVLMRLQQGLPLR